MTSERTISQVRAILSKLDRSIDEAREKRRQVPSPAPAYAPPPPSPAGYHAAPVPPAPAPAATHPHPAPAPAFGRAQPLRPQATNLLRFNGH